MEKISKEDLEKIQKTIKRHLREYVLVERDASYDLQIPDGATISRDSFINILMQEIKEIVEEN